MNAHQRRKYIKANEPVVKRAIATLKIAGMPQRAKILQANWDTHRFSHAINTALDTLVELPHDDVHFLQALSPAKILGSNFNQAVIDEISAFPLQASDHLDSALYAHASGLRLQRSWDWQNIRPDQSVRTTLDCLKSQTQGVGLGTEVPAALDVAERLQEVRS